MDRYQCPECSYIYDEREGDLEQGYDSGTIWAQIESDFYCPDCGIIAKDDFSKLS